MVIQGKSVNGSQTAKRLACAKVWRVNTAGIRAELEQKRTVLCGDAIECALSSALESWLDKPAPLELE